MNAKELAKYIDHTLLKPTATDEDVKKISKEAVEWGCFAVCVNLARLPAALEVVSGTDVIPCSVTSFPLGATGRRTRVFETKEAVALGAKEIDTVVDLGLVKAGKWVEVEDDLKAIKEASDGSVLKVIVETCYLTQYEKLKCLEACINAGAEFIKTSTGFGPSGASIDDILLFKKEGGDRIKIKAAGGIRTLDDAVALIDAGAHRLGMSRTVDVLRKALG